MFDQLISSVMFHQMRYEGVRAQPSEQGTLVFQRGNVEWGGIHNANGE